MMQNEFERLAGREVTGRQYDAFNTLYNESDLDKDDFVKYVRKLLRHIPEPKKEVQTIIIGLLTEQKTLITNGENAMSIKAEIKDINIATGKIYLKKIDCTAGYRNTKEISYFEDSTSVIWVEN